MAAVPYGWGTQPVEHVSDDPQYGWGGTPGSQPGSQADGQGAGITPANMPDQPDPSQGAGASGSTISTQEQQQKAAGDQYNQQTQAKQNTAQAAGAEDYTHQVSQVQNAQTDQERALAKDALSRSLYSSLTEQGHDVKWDGDNLVVDGRPYVVAGGSTSSQYPNDWPGPSTPASGAPSAPPQQQLTGRALSDAWINFTNSLAGYSGPGGAFDASQGRTGGSDAATAARGNMQSIVDQWNANTGMHAVPVGDDKVDFGDGRGPVDVIRESGGGQSGFWFEGGGESSPGGGGGGGGAPTGPAAPAGPAGPPPVWNMPTWTVPTGGPVLPNAPTMQSSYDDFLRQATQRQGDFSVPTVASPELSGDLARWRPGSTPTYQPGEIGTGDIPDFTYGSLLGDMGKGQEGLDALMQGIIANPESLDAHTVDTMKAQMKNTIAEQQQQEEEDLKGFGAASGIGDSGWLAAQRATSRRGRDMGVAAGAQNIDIEAAKTRMGDKRAAAELGMKYGGEKRANIQAASDAALKKASVTGDRLQLREQVKQEAARQGIQADQVMSNFISSQADNLMKKYGIDLGAAVDMKKLGEQSQQFKEELAQKMSALEKSLEMQKYGTDVSAAMSKYGTDVGSATSRYGTDVGAMASRYGADVGASTSRYSTDVAARTAADSRALADQQFAAQLGLSYDQFNRLKDNDNWTRMMDLYGPGGGA